MSKITIQDLFREYKRGGGNSAVGKSTITAEMMLNPSAYGLKECKHCNGYGSSLKEEADRCTVCGGTGLVQIGGE